MEIAALILSILALACSLASLVWLIAKQMSTHQVQLVPVENEIPGFKRPMIGEEFEEFDAIPPMPLSDEELKMAKKKGFA